MNFEGAEVAVTLLSALTFTFDISFNGGGGSGGAD